MTDEHATEHTVWRVTATITGYKLERDGDYHVVLADEHGTTLIVEFPDPGCAATGAWPEQIRTARVAFRRLLADHMLSSSAAKLHRVAVPAVVTGVGFFDRIHGQTGVARNGIELHPVLAIDERPSISELQRLRAAAGYVDTELLHAELPHDLRDAGYKDEVVTEIIALVNAAPVLLEIVAAALAFVATQGDRTEPEWGEFTLALSKVRQ